VTEKIFPKKVSPVDVFIRNKGVLILDGGLATELERKGYDLDHPLWSARLMLTEPEVIRAVHLDYLEAGADCITTAGYQLSYPGCLGIGIAKRKTTELLRETVGIAGSARREFLEYRKDRSRPEPLIAASIGPYGAYLADGAEYTGDYPVTDAELYDFHARRWEILADTEADLLACETIPDHREAKVISHLLGQTPGRYAYLSFSCRDGQRISDGTPIKECAAEFAASEQIIAVGINCTSPNYISELIKNVRAGAPEIPVVVYPNSGEIYDGKERCWHGRIFDFSGSVPQWRAAGARLIGGCCRTGPEHIRAIRKSLK
jgi:homocysteine S-methyltransferase